MSEAPSKGAALLEAVQQATAALLLENQGLRDRAERAEAIARAYYSALDRIASWNEGAVVNGSFDEPGAAQIARQALGKAGQ